MIQQNISFDRVSYTFNSIEIKWFYRNFIILECVFLHLPPLHRLQNDYKTLLESWSNGNHDIMYYDHCGEPIIFEIDGLKLDKLWKTFPKPLDICSNKNCLSEYINQSCNSCDLLFCEICFKIHKCKED